MKKYSFFILFTSFLFLFGCSKDSATPPIEVQDNIKPPYTVKYEVTFLSSATSNNSFNQQFSIYYASEKNGVYYIASAPGRESVTLRYSDLSKVWTRSFTVTVDDNPLQTEVWTNFNPFKETEVNFKIFINNVLMDNLTSKIRPNNNLSIDYTNGITYHVY